jgi:hypothetical protein
MNIATRKYDDYFEVKIESGGVTFDSGFMDADEAKELRDKFVSLVEDLDWFINTQEGI